MINRVSENMKFTTLTGSLFNVQGKAADLMEKISTQKKINRPSDDPIGAGSILNYNSTLSAIDQYQTNVTNAQTWLSLTDTNLSAIKDIISEAQDVATSQSSAVASNETMDASASLVSSLIDSALSSMNAKSGDSYLFGGSKTDVAPFSSVPVGSIGAATAAPVNNFDGTVVSGGTYTGTTNKTYLVKITNADTVASNKTEYKYSTDGGGTWTTGNTVASDGTSTLADGMILKFKDKTAPVIVGDSFTVNATATSIGAASASTDNTFDGTVTSGGTYTGTKNKSYAVKIINGGTSTTAETYQVSSDGGKTWGTTTHSLPDSVLQGSAANTAGGTAIKASTLWSDIDDSSVAVGTTFTINGTDHDGNALTPAGTYIVAAGDTVQNLLTTIKSTFGGSSKATASIDLAGGITLTDNTTGNSLMSMSITTSPSTAINLGTFDATTTATLDEGITMTLAAGKQALAANDLFTVNAYTAGYYRGNDDQLTMQVGKNNNFAYNVTGASAFTAANGPVASASVAGIGSGLTADDKITLTRGGSAGSWTLTTNAQYPKMAITSQSASKITIDADGDKKDDITLDLSGNWNASDTVSFSVTAGTTGPPVTTPAVSAVTVSGPGTVDLLKTLNALKSALTAHDVTAVSAQIDDLKNIQTQVLQAQTEAGAKASSLTTTSTNLTSFNERITSLKSGIEDADLSKLIISYQMEMTAMQSAYNMAAKIGKMTILDYL
jgi:flagellin-like hook-associated protein FlgL